MGFNAAQMRDIWERNGGDPAALLYALSISLAESGWNPDAVSPSDDHGLWQINRMHFAEYGVDDTSVLNPDVNAKIAISLSGNGFNWGPWCTAWIALRDCGTGLLRAPQTGSAAANAEAWVAQQLSMQGPTVQVPQTQVPQMVDVAVEWGKLQYTFGTWFTTAEIAQNGYANQVRGLIT